MANPLKLQIEINKTKPSWLKLLDGNGVLLMLDSIETDTLVNFSVIGGPVVSDLPVANIKVIVEGE